MVKTAPGSLKGGAPTGAVAPARGPAPSGQSLVADARGKGANAKAGADPARPRPRPATSADTATGLLGIEREARRAESQAELGYLVVNGSRVAVPYRQAILLMRVGKGHRVVAVSSLSAIDRTSTFIRWLERLVAARVTDETAGKIVSFDARKESGDADLDASSYPFPRMALVPLKLRDGTPFAHVLFTRETTWEEEALVAAARLCETYAHSWEALSGPARIRRRMRSRAGLAAGAAVAVLLAGFVPVPLSVLAPAEVTAAKPFVVAAPIDGVVEKVAIDPNSPVAAGDVLFRYNDTELRNRLELAGQAVGVAQARLTQSERNSFADARAKRELAIAQSELALKRSEYEYARELLAKSTVTAEASGLVVFSSKDDWTGRPVATGERIMRIADPKSVDLTVHLPVGDAIVLDEGAPVRLYLDADPLNAVDAELVSASFHAQPDAAGVLSYRVRARFADGVTPRIGLRGTAQIEGERVSLAYYLFRKPLAAIRQWTGL